MRRNKLRKIYLYIRLGLSDNAHFFLGAAFLAAFLGVFFAAGFLAAAFLATGFLAAFLGVLAFLTFLAADFLGVFAFLAAFFGLFLAAAFLAVFFLGFLTFLTLGFSALTALKRPDAPTPLTWVIFLSATNFLTAFLMKGEILTMSTLLLAAMYFSIAAKEDPLDSFKALTAARTITALGGCSAFLAGFLALATLGAAASTILNRFVKRRVVQTKSNAILPH